MSNTANREYLWDLPERRNGLGVGWLVEVDMTECRPPLGRGDIYMTPRPNNPYNTAQNGVVTLLYSVIHVVVVLGCGNGPRALVYLNCTLIFRLHGLTPCPPL